MASSVSIILNKNVARKIVQSIMDDRSEEITEIKVDAGSSKGDGYMSSITKVKVESKGSGKELNLIIKMAPNHEQYRNSALLRSSFATEIYFYNTIVKAFEEFQIERRVTDLIKVPKCYKTSNELGNEFLVLQNIKSEGCDMWNRQTQLDKDHIIIGLKQYAKFHAVSYAMKNLKPDMFEKLTKNLELPVEKDYSKYVTNIISLCDRCFTRDADNEVYDTIQKYKDGLENFVEFIKKDYGEHSVILHGDCWTSNMLFKYEVQNGFLKPTDVYFVDFQLSYVGSPALDLCYFLLVSSPKEILNKYKYYLKIYHDELVTTYLKMGGSEKYIPNIFELEEEFKRYARQGFTMALFVFRSMMCEDDEVLNYNDLAKENIEIENMFIDRTLNKEKEVKQLIKTLALFMKENNLF